MLSYKKHKTKRKKIKNKTVFLCRVIEYQAPLMFQPLSGLGVSDLSPMH